MYYYLYVFDDEVHQVIVDNLGAYVQEEVYPMETLDDFPIVSGDDNMFAAGEVIHNRISLDQQVKKPVYFYLDSESEHIHDRLFSMDENDDDTWMEFFDEFDIAKEVNKDSKYFYH